MVGLQARPISGPAQATTHVVRTCEFVPHGHGFQLERLFLATRRLAYVSDHQRKTPATNIDSLPAQNLRRKQPPFFTGYVNSQDETTPHSFLTPFSGSLQGGQSARK